MLIRLAQSRVSGFVFSFLPRSWHGHVISALSSAASVCRRSVRLCTCALITFSASAWTERRAAPCSASSFLSSFPLQAVSCAEPLPQR
ncbi:hypothetical protein GDO78_021358 [Eleutherodactylus coqui]|uniref:Uncharacterized protein n=1 Tax=Eleutherodactylus coqui TaxID=57060 RepID=A0A8J6BES1_ELECQ|nr:hypothetical protein GDO78_021358 [Eleutherodactylus coqui]